MHYTGIGSREASTDVCRAAQLIAKQLAGLQLTLRSGGADGMDAAFERGCDQGKGQKEIYIPWPKFNGRAENDGILPFKLQSYEGARKLAEKFHPNWAALSDPVKNLHTRNVLQVMGSDLKSLSDFVVCWVDPAKEGGTGQALRVAREYGVKIYNIETDTDDILELIMKLKKGN